MKPTSFIRRARGRPLSDIRKEKINVRLHPAVLERMRKAGPGWQTDINRVLMLTTRVDPQVWDQIEQMLDNYAKQIEDLNEQIDLMQRGVMHTWKNHVDTTAKDIDWCKRAITSWSEGIDILHDIQMKLFRDARKAID